MPAPAAPLRPRRRLRHHPLEQLPQLIRHQPLNDRNHDRQPTEPNEITSYDEHDPEGASTAFERARRLPAVPGARAFARLDHALERWERGDCGRCEQCGESIPMERLEVRPAAKTCVRCAPVAR
ncbi:TraR/DksA C4-type zinc finger protein [Streptomyces fagopyri]